MKKIFTLLLLLSFWSLTANTIKLTCPTVTATPTAETLCSGQTTSIQLFSNVANTTFSWNVIPNGVFGCFSGTGNTIIQTLSTSGASPGYVIYIITPFADGCYGTPINVTITVNPKPEIFTSPIPLSICSGDNSGISFNAINPATTYIWNAVATGNVSGASNGSNSTGTIDQVLTLSGQTPGSVTYTVTPILAGCYGNPTNITVNVYPIPTVTVNSPTVCSGSSTTVTATPGATGSYFYAWTVPAGVPNPGNVASFTTSVSGTYSVIATNAASGCASASASGTVWINPVGGNLNLQCVSYNLPGHPGDIYIDWSNVPGITTYNYSYSINGGPVVTGSQNSPSSIFILTNGQPITFTLSGSGSVCVNPETITCGTLSIDENKINDFVISPNPVTDILNIKNNQTINKVNVFNQLGQMVHEKEYNTNEVQLDFSGLKTGIYFIAVDSDKKQSTFKIVKN